MIGDQVLPCPSTLGGTVGIFGLGTVAFLDICPSTSGFWSLGGTAASDTGWKLGVRFWIGFSNCPFSPKPGVDGRICGIETLLFLVLYLSGVFMDDWAISGGDHV